MDHDSILRTLVSDRSKLLAFLIAIGRDVHLAEDIYQDLLVKALRGEHAFDGPDHLMNWARKVSRHAVIDVMRSRDRRTLPLDEDVMDLLESEWSQADAVGHADLSDALRRCLEQLPDASRRLIDLRYRDGMTGQQAAEALSRPVKSVYVSMSRIYDTLAACIRRRTGEGEVCDG